MHKPAVTDVGLHELIRNRWSPRAFAEKPVSPEVLRSLFEAARWAPSSNNEQPWAYLVATRGDSGNFAKMLGVLVEFNANWAKHAPVLALSVAHLKTQREGKPNRVALHDVGSATEWPSGIPEIRNRYRRSCVSANWRCGRANRSANL